VFSGKFSNFKGACPGFEMRSNSFLGRNRKEAVTREKKTAAVR
jgi:hypothetical protein